MSLRSLEPAVSRRTLMVTAAIAWAGVGLMLFLRGLHWVAQPPRASAAKISVVLAVAVALGLIKARFVFLRLAKKNIARIRSLSPHKDRICIFAFQAMRSYLLIIGMITLGILLRISPLPRLYLGGIYVIIGLAMGLSSLAYLHLDR